MAFRNPPIAGLVLVRPALQSPNYVAGSAGWSINRNGSAEFNAGTFRGPITTVVSGDTALLQGNALMFYNQTTPPASRAAVSGVSTATGSRMIIDSGRGNASSSSTLWLLDALNSPDGKSYVRILQKGTNTTALVTGSVLQTDTDSSANNAVHVGVYNIATDAGGSATFSHGAAFTPTAGFLVGVNGIGANFFYQYAWFPSPFTSSTAHAAFKDNTGAALASTTLGAFGIFFG